MTTPNELSLQEKKFYEYWDKERRKKNRLLRLSIAGFRNGLIFCCAVLLTFITGWYKRVPFLTIGDWISTLLGLFCTIVFASIFSGYYKIDQNEQEYEKIAYKLKKKK